MIVVATETEYKEAQKRWCEETILCTGVGGLNVYRSLQNIPLDTPILNFGFVGSNKIPIGVGVEIGECRLYHPNVEYEEPTYHLDGSVCCLTSNDFVLDTNVSEAVVFDMELAYILAMGFTNVKSYKIVSDNLNLNEYKKVEVKNNV